MTTLYELTLSNGTQTFLLAYCESRSRRTLLNVCRKHAEKIVALTGMQEITFAKKAADGATAGAWKIRWTGRTARDAKHEGEHPFISKA